MINVPFAEYAKQAADWVSSTNIIQEWPECLQVCLDRMNMDIQSLVALPFLSCQAVGGYTADVIPVATAWSMLRYAADFLDTVQDGDEYPNGISDPSMAIGYANGLIFAAFDSIATISDLNVTHRVIALFSQTAFRASLGQHLCQQGRGTSETTLESYWQATILKSGSIFKAGLGGGAIAGKASDKHITALEGFGNSLGIIRQIIDDCRDVFEASETSAYEVTLPLLMLALRREEPVVELLTCLNSREALSDAFKDANVPGMIASVLMEWHRRALESLMILKRNEAVIALENILQDFVTTPWLNLGN